MTSTIPNKQEEREKVLFYKKVVLEVIEKEEYSTILEDDVKFREVKIDGKAHYVYGDWGNFDEILESLRKKVEVLRFVSDETYNQMTEEILVDVGRLLYKLTYKQKPHK
jgi:hypothetical protein